MDEEELERQFFTEVLIDLGYVRLGKWEVADVDVAQEQITFEGDS